MLFRTSVVCSWEEYSRYLATWGPRSRNDDVRISFSIAFQTYHTDHLATSYCYNCTISIKSHLHTYQRRYILASTLNFLPLSRSNHVTLASLGLLVRRITYPTTPTTFFKLAPHANERLSSIARHLDPRLPQLPINTPYSTERASAAEFSASKQIKEENTATKKMSSQPEHPALLIPGPIEFDDDVLKSMSHYRYVPYVVLHLGQDRRRGYILIVSYYIVNLTSAPHS